MRFGSVCSGIEAASVAWHNLGWNAAWLSEIEPFPSAVLAHHYPDVPKLGDMTLLPDKILSGEVEAPDILCGGTPCQAFSVAGNRKSLADARGNLSLIFCAIADAIDSVREVPAIVFWENVPGVLSTKDNAFGCFLAELAGESNELIPTGKKWTNAGVIYGLKRTVAWRVLDAQYFGLAQRRKRVFVVASAREDFDPISVLFETDGVRLDKPPSRSSFDPRSPDGNSTIGTLLARDYKGIGNQDLLDGRGLCFEPLQNPLSGEHTKTVYEMHAQDARVQDVGNVLPTMSATYGSGGGNIPVTYGIPDANTVGNPIGTDLYNGNITGDIAATMGTPGSSINASGPTLMQNMMVRRLTPIECERLQGFPDDYTRIPWRKKPASVCPDGPRYKAIGNSWAVPVVSWIGARIAKELSRHDVK